MKKQNYFYARLCGFLFLLILPISCMKDHKPDCAPLLEKLNAANTKLASSVFTVQLIEGQKRTVEGEILFIAAQINLSSLSLGICNNTPGKGPNHPDCKALSDAIADFSKEIQDKQRQLETIESSLTSAKKIVETDQKAAEQASKDYDACLAHQ